MKAHLSKLHAYLDALSTRERVLVFISVIAFLTTAWQVLLMRPLETKHNKLGESIATLQQQVELLDKEIQNLLIARTTDPDAANRKAEQELRAALAQFESRIKDTVKDLVEPKQMAQMLEEVLIRNPGLRLKKVHGLPSTPLIDGEEGAGGAVYRHALRLELEGSYLDALAYLRALQALPRAIYWDEVRVVMDHYPRAQITITVHTLSLSEGWIGA